MQHIFNPNFNKMSGSKINTLDIAKQYNVDPSKLSCVDNHVYEINGVSGATFKFYTLNSSGASTGQQAKFWTVPVQIAWEDYRGKHHPDTLKHKVDTVEDSKRTIAVNIGHMTDAMKAAIDVDCPGTADAIIKKQVEMQETIEKRLKYYTTELHKRINTTATKKQLKEEGVTGGVILSLQRMLKKQKDQQDPDFFYKTTSGKTWEKSDVSGITTAYNIWSRVIQSGRVVYPDILDRSEDIPKNVTPDGSAYVFNATKEIILNKKPKIGAYDYIETNEEGKCLDPHIVKRGQLVKLLLAPQFYCTPNGAKGFRFKIHGVKILKQSQWKPNSETRVDWGDEDDDDLAQYAPVTKKAKNGSD